MDMKPTNKPLYITVLMTVNVFLIYHGCAWCFYGTISNLALKHGDVCETGTLD